MYHSSFDVLIISFFYEIIVKKIGASVLSCGFNYHFGSKALGNTENLKALCEKENIVLPDVTLEELNSNIRD